MKDHLPRKHNPYTEGDEESSLSSQDALTTCFETEYVAFYRYSLTRLRSHEEAEEAIQQAFLRALNSIDQWDRVRSLAPWIMTILKNEVVNITRSTGHHHYIEPTNRSLPASTVLLEESVVLRFTYRQCEGNLSESLRSTARLTELGFSVNEQANILAISTYAAEKRLSRARACLRQCLNH